jgi:uncharacterized protein (DUF58 family)
MNPYPLPSNSSELLHRYGHALDRLEIASRTAGAVVAAGHRPGGATGNSVDFADYRKYHYGDDVRSVDWSIYARLKKLFLRQYRAEADVAIHILLDTSNSMSFGRRPKIDFARALAAVFGYVGLSRQDRVGLATFAGDLVQVLPPQRGKQQLFYLLRTLESALPGGTSDFMRAFQSYAARATTRGVLVILSDCFNRNGYESALRCLAFAGFEVAVVRILADEELDPEIDDEVEIKDIEGEQKRGLVVNGASVGPYLRAMSADAGMLSSFCLHEGFHFVETTTSLSFEELTVRFLRAGIFRGH